MASRTGIPSLSKVARELCRLLAKYTAVIKLLHPTNTDLHNALDAALAACNTLYGEVESVREYGD